MVDGSPANLTAIVARRFTFFLVLSWIPVVLAVLVGWEMACIASLLGVIVLIGTFSSPIRQAFHDRVASARVVEAGRRDWTCGGHGERVLRMVQSGRGYCLLIKSQGNSGAVTRLLPRRFYKRGEPCLAAGIASGHGWAVTRRANAGLVRI
jgi:hypothetical protein